MSLSRFLTFGALAHFSMLWGVGALSTADEAYPFSSRILRKTEGRVTALQHSGGASKAFSPVVAFKAHTEEDERHGCNTRAP
jgi:hypothetical protein